MKRKLLRYKLVKGFTLVELLVALFVFSVMAGFAYKAINTLVKSGDALEEEMNALASVQKAIQSIERDLRQKAVPAIASTESEPVSLSPDKTQLELTLIPSSLTTKQQVLKHIRYRLADKSLVREAWKNNKPTSEQPDEVVTLLKNVASVEFSALDQTAETTTQAWPAYFQITLDHEQLGSVKRIIFFGVKEPEKHISSLAESSKKPTSNQDNENQNCLGFFCNR